MQPLAHRSPGWTPEDPLAGVRVLHDSRIEGHRRPARRLGSAWWCRKGWSGIMPARWASQSIASAREVALRGDDEVDGVASVGVVAGPAAPAFVAPVVGVHGDRGVVVVVVGERAVPASTANVVGGGLGDVVEQAGEVGAVEHVVDLPAGTSLGGASCRHGGVGVADLLLALGEHGLHDRAVVLQSPQRPSSGEMADPVAFPLREREQLGGGGDLIGRLAQDDPGLDVGEQSGGDLGDGGAVVGLCGEVVGPVADKPGGDPVGTGQLQAALEVAGAVADRGPGLVDDLDDPTVVGCGAAWRPARRWRRA